MRVNLRDLINVINDFERVNFVGDRVTFEFGLDSLRDSMVKAEGDKSIHPLKRPKLVDFIKTPNGEWEIDLSSLQEQGNDT